MLKVIPVSVFGAREIYVCVCEGVIKKSRHMCVNIILISVSIQLTFMCLYEKCVSVGERLLLSHHIRVKIISLDIQYQTDDIHGRYFYKVPEFSVHLIFKSAKILRSSYF